MLRHFIKKEVKYNERKRYVKSIINSCRIFWIYSCSYHLDSLALHGPLAQLVEHRTFNPQVQGSSPWWPTLIL